MSRWFRHYAGMMRDEKMVSAAIKSKQPVERVLWVWGAILESAAEIDDGGRFHVDAGEAAYFLRADDADIKGIMDALQSLHRIDQDRVVKWGDRQFTSDRSADRQARYRERKQGASGRGDENVTASKVDGDGQVTVTSRHGDAPDTETELETDTPPKAPQGGGAGDLFDQVWEAFPRNPTSNEGRAEAVFRATKAKDQTAILAAAQRYSRWFTEECERRKKPRDERLSFVPHLGTWIETGAWRSAGDLPLKAENATVVVPMVKLDRVADAALWAACERLQGKRAPTSDNNWHFRADLVSEAKAMVLQ